MDHRLTPEQELLGETAHALFAEHFPIESTRRFIDDRSSLGPTRALGESGLIGVIAPTASGGFSLGALGAVQIVIAAANRLVPFPVADAIVAAGLLDRSRPDLAERTIATDDMVVVAERPLASDGTHLDAVIDGVPWAPLARSLLTEVELPVGAHHVLIDLDRPGVFAPERGGIDPLCPLGRITLDGVALGEADIVAPVPSDWRRLRTILAAAELVGSAQACLAMAVDYMKVRKQFGQEIGRFQALKHIAADGAVSVEMMRVVTEYAAWAHDAGDDEADSSVAIAKSYASDHARRVAEDALQCHGAIGFTWDYDLQLHLRRILRLGATSGTAAEHRERIAVMLADRVHQET